MLSARGFTSGKEPACHCRRQETQVWSLCWKDPLEDKMARNTNILAWRIPWTEYPCGLQSVASQKVGHDWNDLAHTTSGTAKWKRYTGQGMGECVCVELPWPFQIHYPPRISTSSPRKLSKPHHLGILWRFLYVIGVTEYIHGHWRLAQSLAPMPSQKIGRWGWECYPLIKACLY